MQQMELFQKLTINLMVLLSLWGHCFSRKHYEALFYDRGPKVLWIRCRIFFGWKFIWIFSKNGAMVLTFLTNWTIL